MPDSSRVIKKQQTAASHGSSNNWSRKMEHQNNALSLEINLHYLPPKSISCIDPFFQVCKRISSQRGSQTLPKSGGNSKMPGPFWSMLLMLCLASTVCKNWVLDCSKEILHRTSDGSGHIPGHGIWIYIDSIFVLRKSDWINDFHPTSQNHLRYFDKIFFSWPSGGLGHRISCEYCHFHNHSYTFHQWRSPPKTTIPGWMDCPWHLPWAAEILRVSTVQCLGHAWDGRRTWGWTSASRFPYKCVGYRLGCPPAQ